MLPRATTQSIERMKAWSEHMERAKALDPDAFKPVMIPTFTDEQKMRQAIAIRMAETPPAPPKGDW